MEQPEKLPLTKGEPCTIIEPTAEGRTMPVYATGVTEEFVQFSRAHLTRYSRKLDAEGIEWIRGHHAIDSHEVLALLAAGALATEQPLPSFAVTGSVWWPSSHRGATGGIGPPGHFTTTPKP